MGTQTSDKLVETEPSNLGSPDKLAVSDQLSKPAVKPTRKRRHWQIAVGTLVAAVLLFIGIPLVIRAFNTKIVNTAPSLKVAETNVVQAQSDLDKAELNLSYCTVYAEIDGVITRRDVNPGDNLQTGQSVMAIRSLRDIWIDANFKETQLRKLRIGQHVDLELDMYGGKHVFQGRITGFTMGTGSTLALLPAQNATGNFVKVVQRLPVRIDLMNYDPERLPLFVGLSVTPTVDLRSTPTGPNAGKFLEAQIQPTGSVSPRP